jgi:hypothetical protein
MFIWGQDAQRSAFSPTWTRGPANNCGRASRPWPRHLAFVRQLMQQDHKLLHPAHRERGNDELAAAAGSAFHDIRQFSP